MITFLHGDNIVASRNSLVELKTTYQGEIISLNGKSVSLTEIKQALESMSLFSGQRLVVIENLYSRLSKIQLKEILNYLYKENISTDVIFWEGKELTKATVSKFPKNWEVQHHKIQKKMFTFLEKIRPENSQEMLNLLNEVNAQNEIEFVYLMLVRQIRMLIQAKDKALSGMPSWMMYKYQKQADYFTMPKLLTIYKNLFKIDIGQKTGSRSFSLRQELDLLLITI